MKDIIANNQVSTQQHKMDNYSNSMRGQSKTIGYSGIDMGRLAHRTTAPPGLLHSLRWAIGGLGSGLGWCEE